MRNKIILLSVPKGSGKTFIAQAIAQAVGLQYTDSVHNDASDDQLFRKAKINNLVLIEEITSIDIIESLAKRIDQMGLNIATSFVFTTQLEITDLKLLDRFYHIKCDFQNYKPKTNDKRRSLSSIFKIR